MLLSHHMSRMTALKSLLFSERNRVTLSITSAILCSVFELISWIFLYLAVTAIYHNESATAYFLMMCLTVM
ncbi:ABC transporter ATP-binding protein, partial [Vibrio anguillarum]|nr:ABC transporter ATP-binding protein [Vibrio anguillarum]